MRSCPAQLSLLATMYIFDLEFKLKSAAMPMQINYAHGTAFIMRTCPAQLPLLPEFGTFAADVCSVMETDDADMAKQVLNLTGISSNFGCLLRVCPAAVWPWRKQMIST